LIAYAECAGSLSRRAARSVEGRLNEKASTRFDSTALAAMGRIFARESALKVAEEGLRWVAGAGGVSDANMAAFETDLGLSAVHRAQAGLIADMDYVADVLYSRVKKEAEQAVLA
jgi:alkylation response protein AidB-like acyl-CoA dehydrogenase